MIDPDMGTWSYYYDALGQMTLQIDAKNQATVMAYDHLGRMLSRKSPSENSSWSYYPVSAAEKDRGRLDLVSSVMSQWAGTSTPSTYTYQKRVAYDVYGNPVTVTETLPGTTYPSIPTTAYVFNYGYDAWGRLSTKVYPNLRSQLAIVKVSYEYDSSLGHLKALKDPDTGREHWSLLSADADGQTKSER